MNIGFISQSLPYLPSADGFRLIGANLLRHLGSHHRIDLVSLLTEDDANHLDWPRAYCATINTIRTRSFNPFRRALNLTSALLRGRQLHYRRELNAMLRRLSRQFSWDVMHVEGGFVAGLIDEMRLPAVLSLHDAFTLRCDEMLRCSRSVRERAYYSVLRHLEPRYARRLYPRFARCVFVAPRDCTAVQALVPDSHCVVIPNGVDTGYFRPVGTAATGPTLVFHGNLGYAPNVDAVRTFVHDIMPRIVRRVPEVVFHLVGATPSPDILNLVNHPRVKLSANLPDLRSAVCAATVYVCAVRHGSGIKNKILEAMAMQRPIVSYPAALDGIGCRPGEHLLTAASPDEFSDHVLMLLRCPERASDLGSAARKFVEEHYSWESQAHAYEQLYAAIIRENAGGSRRVRHSEVTSP
jgi:glycosyltransferase involved in cell wall biosynthesis